MLRRNDVEFMSSDGRIWKIGYCQAQYLLNNVEAKKVGYNAGVYGWNYDVYLFRNNVIITGYRCTFGNSFNYNLLKEYEKKAEAICYNYIVDYEEKNKLIADLLQELIKKQEEINKEKNEV